MTYPNNYGGLEEEFSNYEKAKVAVLLVAFEGTVTYGKGTSKAPQAIINASKNMELYDEELAQNFSTSGITTLAPTKVDSNAEKTAEYLYQDTKKVIFDNKFPVIFGGEHSITWGAAKACKEKYPDLSVLYLDAHADLRDTYDNDKFNHACSLKRVLDVCPNFVEVGVRSMSDEEARLIKKRKMLGNIYFAKDIMTNHDNKWMDQAVSKLTKNVYISIDIDCLDVSIMPATGTPEPGGLGWYQVLELMRKVCNKKNVVGFDIVELAPIPGYHAPNFLVAKLAYKIIGYTFFGKK